MSINYVEEVMHAVVIRGRIRPNLSVAHQLDHVVRVMRWVKLISDELKADGEKIDMEILNIATYLHEVRQPHEDKSLHVSRSVSEAEEILKSIGYPKDGIKMVLRIISQHSSEIVETPDTIEAKVLFDADKLDRFGAIGIGRVLTMCGQQGMPIGGAILWYKEEIAKIKPLLQTEIAKKVVEEKEKFVNIFFKEFFEEEEYLNTIVI